MNSKMIRQTLVGIVLVFLQIKQVWRALPPATLKTFLIGYCISIYSFCMAIAEEKAIFAPIRQNYA